MFRSSQPAADIVLFEMVDRQSDADGQSYLAALHDLARRQDPAILILRVAGMTDALTLLSFGSEGWGDEIARGTLITVSLALASLPEFMMPEKMGLEQVLPELRGPTTQAYFVYPEELRHSKRIAVFRDFLLRKVAEMQF